MKVLLNRAMFLLSRRDHSEHELRRKLALRPAFKGSSVNRTALKSIDDTEDSGAESENKAIEIDAVIQYCTENRYLDDLVYAGRFIRSRSTKGYGLQRIQSELSQKGVASELVAQAVAECDIDWCILARTVAERKFGTPLPNEWKSKAKILRYLAYRGFFHEEMAAAFDNSLS